MHSTDRGDTSARRNFALGVLTCAICSVAAGLSGCNATAVTVNEQPVYTPEPLLTLKDIPDRNLAGCIEQTISDQRAITADELTMLSCSSAGIESLAGLEQLKGLRQLNLRDNGLTRVEVLQALPQLQKVNLEENPRLSCADLKTLQEMRGDQLEVRAPDHC